MCRNSNFLECSALLMASVFMSLAPSCIACSHYLMIKNYKILWEILNLFSPLSICRVFCKTQTSISSRLHPSYILENPGLRTKF